MHIKAALPETGYLCTNVIITMKKEKKNVERR
jgi:hypothetical protein